MRILNNYYNVEKRNGIFKQIAQKIIDSIFITEYKNDVLTKALQNDTAQSKIYTLDDFDNYMKISIDTLPTVKNKNITYINLPCSFDIETSSWYDDKDKKACMYIWQFAINGVVIIGRTWDEFLLLLDKLQKYLVLHSERRLIVYVHNLSYEFQFMRKHIKWEKTFNIDSRKPIYALSEYGIEFRCSYILSGKSLKNIKLNKYDVVKLDSLDYNLKRHSGTRLSEKELAYCINDVRVVCAYIDETIQNDGDISKIPLTKTGYVRKYVRNKCLSKQYHKTYKKLMSDLTITDNEYLQLKSAFQGGFTHASCLKSTKTYYNVSSYDFTSSYPTVLVSEQFPMSRGKTVKCSNLSDFFNYIDNYCCLFEITFYDLKPKVDYEHIISKSKCTDLDNGVIDNGRVISADKLSINITDVDFDNINMFYTYSKFDVDSMIIYDRGYLPRPIIESVLTFYEQKTKLKDVENCETEYNYYKELLNAIYGMIVTDIVRDNDIYDEEWTLTKGNIKECIEKYNDAKNRVLFYPWGVWCTAYARHNLFTGICEFKDDYIYSDTDSLKVLNMSNHIDYINEYNNIIVKKLERCLDNYSIDKSKIRPLNNKNIPKTLGIWTYEGTYERFKTLGAKRYMYTKNNELHITISGVNKERAIEQLTKKYSIDKIFDLFNDNMVFDEDTCGKQTHTYIDASIQGTTIDYLGQKGTYNELSYIHLEPTTYSLKLSTEYKQLLQNIIGGIKNGK